MLRRESTLAWEKELLERVARSATRFGFDGRVRDQSTYRRIPELGWSALHLSFARYSGSVEVSADVAIRFDAVEDLVNMHDPRRTSKKRLRTATLGTELGNFARGAPLYWTITAPDEVPPVAEQVMEAFEEIGVPYLDQFETMELAYVALSGNERQAQLHSPINWARCARALALAIILERRQDIPRLVASCEDFLGRVDQRDLIDFQSFARAIIA